MMIVKAGLRTLHEAGPELQRTISTDLEVVLYFILNTAVMILFIFAIIDDYDALNWILFFEVMMAAEAMAGAEGEEDIHTRFVVVIITIIINIIISITTCLQTSRSSTVWSNCPGVQEAYESVAKAEEDGLRLPGHDKTEAVENDHNQ